MTWHQHLQPYLHPNSELLDAAFDQRWGAEKWTPDSSDKKAAAKLHNQLVSRITTQRLRYLEGVEQTALTSVYQLFGECRRIVDQEAPCRHFETIAWHVLNTWVRPFTAKWHRESERGVLASLDATDEFRSELTTLQETLRKFEELLAYIRDDQLPAAAVTAPGSTIPSSPSVEDQTWPAGDHLAGVSDGEIGMEILAAERSFIEARRRNYDIPEKSHTIGLALSGGGIRSATFSLGILVALAKRSILPQIDYLSTVSGGGYIGSFLTVFLNSRFSSGEAIGLNPSDLPFRHEEGEAEALRHIRHHSKYLSSRSLWERVKTVSAQLYGMLLNFVGIIFVTAVLATVEFGLRNSGVVGGWWRPVASVVGLVLLLVIFISPALLRAGIKCQKTAETLIAAFGCAMIALLMWKVLGRLHSVGRWLDDSKLRLSFDHPTIIALLGAIPAIASAFSAFMGRRRPRTGAVLVWIAAVATPIFLFVIYLGIYVLLDKAGLTTLHVEWLLGMSVLLVLLYFVLLNINFTSPHRHYRNKLAAAFLIQPKERPTAEEPFDEAIRLKLSEVGKDNVRGPYPLWNAALNVPSSKNPGMQGRLTDFFLFSPFYCGSPLVSYRKTQEWERRDPHLDVGTAMAISAAAAAPQMGVATRPGLRFWLALLNVRLGYWLQARGHRSIFQVPGLWYLLREMLGWMNEKSKWINVSDGGHIENLGVYELLRRRCRYIIAVDGEQDQKMTFAALTTLQRLAAIDLDTQIDINLDDLRLNTHGLSRSHFRFCRIRYPGGSTGYLLYLKLSLTGNEGEFIRRYRTDDPAFPHDSTANQFFTEAQFEAYRSLGEHIGDKLFLRALVGELATSKNVNVEQWFDAMIENLLD